MSDIARGKTLRPQAEDAAHLCEERYRSLAAASSQLVWTTNARGEVVEDLPGWQAYTGQSPLESRGLGWMAALHPADRSRVTNAWRQAFRNRTICEVEIRLRRKDGEYGHFRARGVPVLEKDGRIREWVGMCADTTEHRQAGEAFEASEKRYRELVALAPIGIYRSTHEGRFDSVNLALVRLLGYDEPGDVLALDMRKDVYVDNRDRERLKSEIARLGGVAAFEVRWKRRDGAPLWVRLDARVVRGESGGVEYETFVHDIHTRKRAEEALLLSEERFHRSFSVSPVAMSLTEAQTGFIVDINERFAGLLGYGREELIGKTSVALSLWAEPAERERIVADVDAGVPIRDREIQLRTKTGEVRYIVGSIEPLVVGEERVLLSGFQDMTERRNAEEGLRNSEERYRLLFESNPFPMWVFDNETLAFLAVNEAACLHYGYSREEFLSMTIADIRPPEDVPALLRRIETDYFEHRRTGIRIHRRKDGTRIPVEITSNPFVFDGRAAQLVLANDVTARLRAEEAMRKSEERFRRLFDSNTIGIAIADLDGRTLEANDAYLNIIGYSREEMLSGTVRWEALTPPEHLKADRAAVEMLRRTGVAETWEKEFIRKDGTRVPVLIGVAMLEASEKSCIAYVLDLSARRLLESQFRQAQKMEAVGRLAGGVAHDFNNLLTVILGYCDVVRDQLAADNPLREEVGQIRKAGERAAGLTRQLLAFSRTQVLVPEVLDINAVVNDVDKMLRRVIGEDIDLRTVCGPAIGCVKADKGQLEQVLMNLAVNSRDAMPRGGSLTIETSNVEFDEAYVGEHAAAQPGSYVLLAVSDTGAGMAADTKSHLFEPFFTTKEKGKGTGLGLATVYGIVKQSGGFIRVHSEPGRGTTFRIYLPRVEAQPGEPARPAPLALESTRGTETVLLVEDEEGVRRLTRGVLEERGYTVLEANGWQSALDIAASHPSPIPLVLTDVVMPEMGGPEVAARLTVLRPGIKVLYMSGYTGDAAVHRGLLEAQVELLQKPFTPGALARRVRGLLDAG